MLFTDNCTALSEWEWHPNIENRYGRSVLIVWWTTTNKLMWGKHWSKLLMLCDLVGGAGCGGGEVQMWSKITWLMGGGGSGISVLSYWVGLNLPEQAAQEESMYGKHWVEHKTRAFCRSTLRSIPLIKYFNIVAAVLLLPVFLPPLQIIDLFQSGINSQIKVSYSLMKISYPLPLENYKNNS